MAFKATKDFNDAGTERSFRKGETVTGEAGALVNYRAAGLVEEVAATTPKTKA